VFELLLIELDFEGKGGFLGMGFMEIRKKVANRKTGARPEAASRANRKMVGDRVRSWGCSLVRGVVVEETKKKKKAQQSKGT
jgi:hypothetical protein